MTAVARPVSLAETLELLAQAPRAHLLAGGTDLMVELQTGRTRPERIVDVSAVGELRGIHRDAAGTRLFARTTCTEVLGDAHLAAAAPLLRSAVLHFAAPQIRHRATIGGNLATASPAADLAPVWFALDAVVRLRSRRAARDVPIAAFFTGYRQHAARPDELIESIHVPVRPAGERSAFAKAGTRSAQAIAKVAVAVTAVVRDGVVTQLRAGAGAVADRTVSLPSLHALVGRTPTAQAIREAATAAALHDVAPIDDVRSTARYRRHALQRLLISLLERLLLEA